MHHEKHDLADVEPHHPVYVEVPLAMIYYVKGRRLSAVHNLRMPMGNWSLA
jgi:hypothetical protein